MDAINSSLTATPLLLKSIFVGAGCTVLPGNAVVGSVLPGPLTGRSGSLIGAGPSVTYTGGAVDGLLKGGACVTIGVGVGVFCWFV